MAWRLAFLRGFVACVSIATTVVRADNRAVLIDEILVGANGDSSVQFVELKLGGPGDGAWGPQADGKGGVEPGSRVELVFLDAAGDLSGVFPFPADAPIGVPDADGLHSVLVATPAFAALPAASAPDFILPPGLLVPGGGQMIFRNTDSNPSLPVRLHLSYGDFAGDTGDDGLNPATAAGAPGPLLPLTGVRSLRRFQNLDAAHLGARQENADFRLDMASPRSSEGITGALAELPPATQGERLFFKEAFRGNGRVCGTCHVPDRAFALSAHEVAGLLPGDPLFVPERDPLLANLENACAVRSSNALILENIDGFDEPPSFRGSPALFNLIDTAPYGLSGEFPDLDSFTRNAVLQHFPRTLERNADPLAGSLDVRMPTGDEVAALSAFLLSLRIEFTVEQMMAGGVARGEDAVQVRAGHEIFFGDRARCFLCHSGPSLSDVHPSLVDSGVVSGPGNHAFATGVAVDFQLLESFEGANSEGRPVHECFEENPPLEIERERAFDTRPLVGAALRGSFFHDNSRHSLHDAVLFYCTGCDDNFFTRSPAFDEIGGIDFGGGADVNAVVAFLRTLVPPPVECITGPDCNGNGIEDACELRTFPERDCNGDGIIDACTSGITDCNRNGIEDHCDLGVGNEEDCDRNGVPDSCDLRDATRDCDSNGTLDACERRNRVALAAGNPAHGITLELGDERSNASPLVSSAGDVDGDGLEDLLLAVTDRAVDGVSNRGTAYILFGNLSLQGLASLRPEALPPSDRLEILPPLDTTRFGDQLAALGDIDGDGTDDVAIGASQASPGGRLRAGSVFILHGGPELRTLGTLSLEALPAARGFRLDGVTDRDGLGSDIAAAGDWNGDGLQDIVLGARFADPLGRANAGAAYVVPGQRDRSALAAVSLASLGAAQGWSILGAATRDGLGARVAGIGDFNADGIDDIAIGANGATVNGQVSVGRAYVLFGRRDAPGGTPLDLAAPPANAVLTIEGSEAFGTNLGMGLAGIGDVNDDGNDDLFFGAPTNGGAGGTGGVAHVVFGGPARAAGDVISLASLPLDGGFSMRGGARDQRFGSDAVGRLDLNADGIDDLVVGDLSPGHLFVIHGKATHVSGSVHSSELDAAPLAGDGLLLVPADPGDSFASIDLALLGDLDGDGAPEIAIGRAGDAPHVRILRAPFHSLDCDVDGVLDSCQIAAGTRRDTNGNGVPDRCEGLVPPTAPFRRGDSNEDGRVDVSDAVRTLIQLFLEDVPLRCEKSADANDDGAIDVSDVILTLEHLFLDGAPLAAPGASCGEDPSPDALGCEAHAAC